MSVPLNILKQRLIVTYVYISFFLSLLPHKIIFFALKFVWLSELMFEHVKGALLPIVTSSWEAGAGLENM